MEKLFFFLLLALLLLNFTDVCVFHKTPTRLFYVDSSHLMECFLTSSPPPVAPVGNSSVLPIGAGGDTRRVSPPYGELQFWAAFNQTVSDASQEWRKAFALLLLLLLQIKLTAQLPPLSPQSALIGHSARGPAENNSDGSFSRWICRNSHLVRI